MKERLYDLLVPTKEDDRSGVEIVENIREKLRKIGGE